MIRPCGECTACCTVMCVESIGKATGVRCTAVRPNGCAMYDRRPKECAGWYCCWAMGKLPDDHRPDKLGMLFYPLPTTDISRELRRKFDQSVWVVREFIPGAFEKYEFTLNILVQNHLLICFPVDGGRTYRGRPDVMKWLSQHARMIPSTI